MRRRRMLAITASLLILSAFPLAATPATGKETSVAYSIRDARAYAFRVSLRKEVIEAAQTAQPCDAETDPYHCDNAAYNHTPNCPSDIEVGRQEVAVAPSPVADGNVSSGRAGEVTGAGSEPPLASPITLNEQVTLATLGHQGEVLEAAGLSSDGYVDLSGRQEPEMHAESDAFTPNRASLEERCFPEENVEDSYKHFLSWSSEAPETYQLAECFKDECLFDQLTFSAEAVRAQTIVHLYEEDGVVHGELESRFQNASWAGGMLEVDLLETYVSFESDGTPDGLEWSVTSRAVGARLYGEPVSLQEGELMGNEDFQVGIAAPFVDAAKNGTALRIVAPGLAIASGEQTAFFAGAEIAAALGRDESSDLGTDLSGSAGLPRPKTSGAVTIGGRSDVAPPASGTTSTGAPETVAAPEVVLSVEELMTGAWPVALTFGLGALGLLLVLTRWLNRFSWGRRLYRFQPLRALDWIYRAFVKT
ncbi:MAG: hypothetical protein ACRDH6_05545 [Actinomycetota bacterium]